MKYKNSYQTCAWIICYMFPVQCEELRINHLIPLLVVTVMYACWFLWRVNYIEVFKWCPHLQFGVTFWRVVLREVYFEEPNCIWRALKGSILKTGYLPPPPPVSLICSTCFFPTTQGHTVIHTHCIPSPLVFPARVTQPGSHLPRY